MLLDDPDANSWIPKVDAEWSGAIPATLILKGDKQKFYEKEITVPEGYQIANIHWYGSWRGDVDLPKIIPKKWLKNHATNPGFRSCIIKFAARGSGNLIDQVGARITVKNLRVSYIPEKVNYSERLKMKFLTPRKPSDNNFTPIKRGKMTQSEYSHKVVYKSKHNNFEVYQADVIDHSIIGWQLIGKITPTDQFSKKFRSQFVYLRVVKEGGRVDYFNDIKYQQNLDLTNISKDGATVYEFNLGEQR